MVSDTDFTFSLAGAPYLEFLPVVDLRSGRLLGLEALVRWQHPTEGVIPPSLLIPEAEISGDIEALTRWVLMEACGQACAWSPSIQLGVNCTIEQLRRGEVSKAAEAALEGTGLPSGQLTLEVTEDAIGDPSASGDLKDLSRMGVQLSVDDVGTNWSSFEPFKRHAISTVKIDGSFVAGLESTQGINRLVVETVIHMAHSLGMSALVEQVETPAQVELVRSFGADAAQGFFFALPMSSEDAADLARRDEVPHYSRTSERTLLRPVDEAPVEERVEDLATRDAGAGDVTEGEDDGETAADATTGLESETGGEGGPPIDEPVDADLPSDALEDQDALEIEVEVDDEPVETPAQSGRPVRKRLKGRSSRSA
jgi:EAL domain-containing protein (putative c-di-GMP-specific phosphodiesterase class I)